MLLRPGAEFDLAGRVERADVAPGDVALLVEQDQGRQAGDGESFGGPAVVEHHRKTQAILQQEFAHLRVAIRGRVVGTGDLERVDVFRGLELLRTIGPYRPGDVADSPHYRVAWAGSRVRRRSPR